MKFAVVAVTLTVGKMCGVLVHIIARPPSAPTRVNRRRGSSVQHIRNVQGNVL